MFRDCTCVLPLVTTTLQVPQQTDIAHVVLLGGTCFVWFLIFVCCFPCFCCDYWAVLQAWSSRSRPLQGNACFTMPAEQLDKHAVREAAELLYRCH
jgi:hypothetical protein